MKLFKRGGYEHSQQCGKCTFGKHSYSTPSSVQTALYDNNKNSNKTDRFYKFSRNYNMRLAN